MYGIICREHEDGTITAVRVFNDAGPKGAGRILRRYYYSSAAVSRLLREGDIVRLDRYLGLRHDGFLPVRPEEREYTTFYHRDCGSSWSLSAPRSYNNIEELERTLRRTPAITYLYLYREGVWEGRHLAQLPDGWVQIDWDDETTFVMRNQYTGEAEEVAFVCEAPKDGVPGMWLTFSDGTRHLTYGEAADLLTEFEEVQDLHQTLMAASYYGQR